MYFLHSCRVIFILNRNSKSMREIRDKQALVIRTNYVSCGQGAMDVIGCISLSRIRVRRNKLMKGIYLEGRINTRVTHEELDDIR